MLRALKLRWSHYRLMKACDRLARDVERRKQIVTKYPQRRASAKLGWARRKGVV